MNPFEKIEEEHERIEQMLIELEVVINTRPINYPNLIHTLRQLLEVWPIHEEHEEKVFKALAKKGFKIPVTKIDFEHGSLRKQFADIKGALSIGSEFLVKGALEDSGKKLIENLRGHMHQEEWILNGLSWDALGSEIKEEILKEASGRN